MRFLTEELKLDLKKKACQVRMGIIESTHGAKAGHPGGSLSAAEMFAYLYNKELRVDPKNPRWPDRDRFVLSKGHTAPGLYAALAYRGFFPVDQAIYIQEYIFPQVFLSFRLIFSRPRLSVLSVSSY